MQVQDLTERAVQEALESSFCAVILLNTGRFDFSVPELGRRTIQGSSWCLLRDLGPKSTVSMCEPVDGVLLTLDLSMLESLAGMKAETASKLDCLFCPRRSAAFFASGTADSKMLRLARTFRDDRHALTACGFCRQQGAAYELLGEVLGQIELREKPDCHPCIPEEQKQKLQEVARFLENHLDADHSLADLSRRFYLNECTLKQGFKALHGRTVFTYLREARMLEADRLLREGKPTVLSVANAVGYSNPSQFAKAFRSYYGCNPGQLVSA